ncbi:MAG: 50S ribosomal protein L1 [Gammaproteobacteria bacterium]|nr:50S ribosomal protein L1 [Gammaproteobacteria bacterium]MXW50909.1 50S ribosomal protein L1 [Gammaproteobacteria bacterium]MXX28330.1 50S ribosomal protein L1 [Gammaproteobacteria bacterium]MYE52955.1 50S ribosomal protein L1 [Gammaproteobacteria bacterium]MYE86921.1 50S ribosomal protein L1 [Gammaproteobacteria bacterium]
MGKLSRRRQAIAEAVDQGKFYPIDEAVGLLSELSKTKFKESFDVSVNLGVDVRKSDQTLRGASTLPHGTGKAVRVAVFAQGESASLAEAAGADAVGLDELAERIKGGDLNFDVVIATPDAMRVVGPLGRLLGPRGLMPNPKTGTVTADVEAAVKNAKAGQVRFRTDRGGIVHGSVGQVGFSATQIKENLETLVADLKKSRPASAKGVYLKKITLSTTMGPGLAIDQASLEI